MNYQQLKKFSRAYAKLPGMGSFINEAKDICYDFFTKSKRPQISVSGGKDSVVMLAIALDVYKGSDLRIVWTHDWCPPGTYETILAVEKRFDIHVTKVQADDTGKDFRREFGSVKHQHLPGMDIVKDTYSAIVDELDRDGLLLGLRAEESSSRAYIKGGPFWSKSLEMWRANPLVLWTWREVWAYLITNNLPVHPAYKKAFDTGVKPEHARMGPLTAYRVYQYGALQRLRETDLDAWNQFTKLNPSAKPY